MECGFWMRSITPTVTRKIEIPSRMASTSDRGSYARAAANTIIARIDSVNVMNRGEKGSIRGDITSSLGSNFAQPSGRRRELPATHQLHGMHQCCRRVAHLGLELRILVEIVVARGIGLVVADIAVELGGMP